MPGFTRREFVAAAAAMGATLAWGAPRPTRSRTRWVERRDLFAQGVASGDPGPDSVLLWTRASSAHGADAVTLAVEVAEDQAFERVSPARRRARSRPRTTRAACSSAGSCPGATYWYRFTTGAGEGSRIGRTRTAAAPDDPAPVAFSFVSCQNVCEGAQNAYRRMIFEDERRARRGAARVRPAPGRLRLRGGRVPRGPARGPPLRPPPAVSDPLPGRREGARVPRARDGGRLSRALSRLPPGPGPAGRARPLAVRGHVGQPRVLVDGLAVGAGAARRRPARARRRRSPPTRPGSSTSRRASARWAANRSSGSTRRP